MWNQLPSSLKELSSVDSEIY